MSIGRAADMVGKPLQTSKRPHEGWSWEETHDFMANMAMSAGMWAGIPVPVGGFAFTVEPHYPKADVLTTILDRRDDDPIKTLDMVRRNRRVVGMTDTELDDATAAHGCKTDDVGAVLVRNTWWSTVRQARVYLYETEAEPGRVRIAYDRRERSGGRRATFMLSTIGVSTGWDIRAEERAMGKLQRMIAPHLFDMYRLTGCFLESSARSNVHYVLRRCRPTVAMVPWDRTDPSADDLPMRTLTVLCMHPIGYYTDTFAGAMVPTDDVIAYLLMIRADEHLLWRRAYHHHPEEPEAGL